MNYNSRYISIKKIYKYTNIRVDLFPRYINFFIIALINNIKTQYMLKNYFCQSPPVREIRDVTSRKETEETMNETTMIIGH